MRAGDALGPGLQRSEKARGTQEASRERILKLGALGYDFQLPLDRGLPPCHPFSPRAQSHSQPGGLLGGQESLGEGLAKCHTAQQGAPHFACPSSRDRDPGPGSCPSLLAMGGGREAYVPQPQRFPG